MILAIDPGCTYGKLTVLREVMAAYTPNGTRVSRVLCRCACGNEKVIRVPDITRTDPRKTVSCGCHRKAQNIAQKAPVNIVHGLSSRTGSHYLYTCWKGIKRRCLDADSQSYYLYGARGITVYEPWIHDAGAFAAYIQETLGDRPKGCTLDRIDTNGSYVPGNLRWATASEQVANRRPYSEWRPWGTSTGRRAR